MKKREKEETALSAASAIPDTPIYSFGPFRMNAIERSVLKNHEPIGLSSTEFALLLALVEGLGRVVPKQVLRSKIWGERTHLDDNNLAQTLTRLRKKLGHKTSGESYIKTIHNQGCQLTEAVRTEYPTPEKDRLPLARLVTAIPKSAVLVMVLLLVFAAIRSRPAPPLPIASDEFPKSGPLWTNGKRVYFGEQIDTTLELASVPVTGGEVTRMPIPDLAQAKLLDAREPGPEILLLGSTPRGEEGLWSWVPGQKPRWIMESVDTRDAGWMVGSRLVELTKNGKLRVINQGKVEHVIPVPLSASFPRWSASRRCFRFTFSESDNRGISILQLNDTGRTSMRIAGLPENARYGTWGLDSHIFAFIGSGRQESGIWIAREARTPGGPRLAPVRLIDSPFAYDWVVPSPDGHQIFALGTQERGKLLRFDAPSKRFVPYLGGMAAFELDYAPDNKSIVYVRYPDRSLWKAHSDGTERIELVAARMEAAEPHWSPDGSKIAFMGQMNHGPRRIYLIDSTGGHLKELNLGGRPEGVPTWGHRGSFIVYGDVLQDPPRTMHLHLFDTKSLAVTEISGSDGLWTPRWSPNDRFVSALSTDNRRLKIYDFQSKRWRDLASFPKIEYTQWTADSQYIHFRALLNEPSPLQVNRRALYRIKVDSGNLEKITDLDDFPFGIHEWFGITPDGQPLGLGGFYLRNIYAIPVS